MLLLSAIFWKRLHRHYYCHYTDYDKIVPVVPTKIIILRMLTGKKNKRYLLWIFLVYYALYICLLHYSMELYPFVLICFTWLDFKLSRHQLKNSIRVQLCESKNASKHYSSYKIIILFCVHLHLPHLSLSQKKRFVERVPST